MSRFHARRARRVRDGKARRRVAASAGTLIFYARWHDWYGGWCYGPRFLCECIPTVCLVFALAYSSLASNWTRRLAIALIAISVFIHFAGVFGSRAETSWYTRNEKQNNGRWLFSVQDTQIAANTRMLFVKLGERLGLWKAPWEASAEEELH